MNDVRNEDEGHSSKATQTSTKKRRIVGNGYTMSSQKVPEGRGVTTIEIVPGYPYAKLRDRHLAKNTKHKEHQAINTGKLRKTGERHEGTEVI